MPQDIHTNLAEKPGGPWWLRKVVVLLLIAACMDLTVAGFFPVTAETHARTGIGEPIDAHTAGMLARQVEGADSADPPGQITAADVQEASDMNLKTTPPELDDLQPFTPSEAIEAGQAVDFPYDI